MESECASARDDAALALITQMCRLVYGDGFRLQTVNFKHSQTHRYTTVLRVFWLASSILTRRENQLYIPSSMADEILTGADPELALLNDQVVTRRLARIDKGNIVARLQAVLMDLLPNGNISDDAVAAALHMSVRTMHRKLTEVRQQFQDGIGGTTTQPGRTIHTR